MLSRHNNKREEGPHGSHGYQTAGTQKFGLGCMVTRWVPSPLTSVDLNWTSHQEHQRWHSVQVFEDYGGPVATRTPDLYRVKVAL